MLFSARRPILCFITNRRLYADDDRTAWARVLDAVRAAAVAGVDLIQIRERDLDGGALLTLAREAIARTTRTAARVLVNDRVDVAMAAGAHGVHLRGDSMPATRVRNLVPAFLIGRSVHGIDEASARDVHEGCDYLLAGTVFPTPSKAQGHALLGVDGLSRLCAVVRLPVIAVGGMSIERSAEVARAGAAGVAGIRLFADPSTVAETVVQLRRSFDT